MEGGGLGWVELGWREWSGVKGGVRVEGMEWGQGSKGKGAVFVQWNVPKLCRTHCCRHCTALRGAGCCSFEPCGLGQRRLLRSSAADAVACCCA
jgi:hypothetical protein